MRGAAAHVIAMTENNAHLTQPRDEGRFGEVAPTPSPLTLTGADLPAEYTCVECDTPMVFIGGEPHHLAADSIIDEAADADHTPVDDDFCVDCGKGIDRYPGSLDVCADCQVGVQEHIDAMAAWDAAKR